jgi:membrane associated rhomboid family serine protease
MTNFRPQGFQILPPLVKNLIIINALVLALDSVLEKYGIRLSDYLGLHYWKSHYFRPWQLITHLFMHGNIGHLLSNMFTLWMFGSVLENYWGPQRFLTFYLVCGIGAAFCHLTVLGFEYTAVNEAFSVYQQSPGVDKFARFVSEHISGPSLEGFRIFQNKWENDPGNITYLNQSSYYINMYIRGRHESGISDINGLIDQVTVGASGAVFGVLFAFGYLFPNMELMIYFLFPMKAKYFVALFALVELWAGIQNSAGDNVAHFAHLGGMLFAWLLLRYWQKNNRRQFY